MGSTTALEWEVPGGDGEQFDSDLKLNVSHENNSAEVTFQFSEPGQEDYEIEDTNSVQDNYSSEEFSLGSGLPSGKYNFKANTSDGEEVSVQNIMFDDDVPVVSFPNRNYVSDNPTLTVKLRDDHSGPNSDSYDASVDNNAEVDNIDGFGSCTPGNDCNVDIDVDTGDLDTNTDFVLTMDAEDNVGNSLESGEDSKTFTYDSSYEADSPEIDGFDVEVENGVASVNGDVDVDVNVPNIDDETSDAMQVECIVDGDTVDTTDWESSNDFECELPIDEIENQEVDVEARACDRVNHCEKSSIRTVTFDASDPEVERLETVQDYKVFGDDFKVEYEASDEATSIENVEYFFSSAFTEGEGYEANTVDGSFTVDTSKLNGDSNERTLYIRVQDESGRWSQLEEVSQVGFEYYPEAQPTVSLDAPSNITLVSGQSKDLEVDVENPGKLRLGNLTISLESEITDSSENVEGIEGGETVDISFSMSPNESHLGASKAEISSDGPLDSETVNILVNANEDQKKIVSRKIENYSTKLENMKSNISELRNQGLKSELNTTIEKNTSDFEEMVVSAQSFVEEEKYHKAYRTLENIEEEYNRANKSYSKVEQQHELNKRNEKLMFAGMAVLMLSLGGLYYTKSSDTGFELSDFGLEIPESVDIPSLPEIGSLSLGSGLNEFDLSIEEKIGEFVDSVKEFIEEEEEEVQEGFEGFR